MKHTDDDQSAVHVSKQNEVARPDDPIASFQSPSAVTQVVEPDPLGQALADSRARAFGIMPKVTKGGRDQTPVAVGDDAAEALLALRQEGVEVVQRPPRDT